MAFRKIPDAISRKLEQIQSRFVVVAATKNISLSNIDHLQTLKFKIEDGKLHYPSEFVPPISSGTASTLNGQDRVIVRDDLEKVDKEFYLGLRPAWGDWSKGSFPLFQTRKVYLREFIKAPQVPIVCEVIKVVTENDVQIFTVNFKVDKILDKNDSNFDADLLQCLGLLHENVGISDVYDIEATEEDYLKSVYVDWEIFPPGSREALIAKMAKRYKKMTEDKKEHIRRKIDFLEEMKPLEIILGMSGNTRYIGAKYAEDLVVFENVEYGNAVYILYEDWKTLSKKSRSELLVRNDLTFDRVVHSGEWEKTVKAIVLHRKMKKAKKNLKR